MTARAWNRGQRIANGLVLAALMTPLLVCTVAWMGTFADPKNPESMIGYVAWTAWLCYVTSKAFVKILNAGVDKTERTG